jgi:glycosyltransferase involved in cell wall biosynthesis
MPGPVIYLVRSWPRLSQTFILNEILALQRRGVDVQIISLVRSNEAVVQPQVADVRARVDYLDAPRPRRRRVIERLSVVTRRPVRYVRALRYAQRHPELSSGYATSTTMGCFQYAVQIAAAVLRIHRAGTRPRALHAHFAHDPALVALLVHRLTGLPYSFTGHARDLLQIPAASLVARSREARTVITCCQANATYIEEVVPRDSRPPVRVIHHGVDLDIFRPGPRRVMTSPAVLTTVGRLVDKKGFPDLLRAMRGLKSQGHVFQCRIYGDGPNRGSLVALRDSLDLTAEVEFAGEHGREAILKALGDADVFVLTPIVTPDGDRDGIPNVLVEAMACGLPVVTTAVGGITELVEHESNGLLTAPGDIAGIEQQVARLLRDPSLRNDIGVAARRTVESGYDVDAAARELNAIFRADALSRNSA